ncbi:MAG: hypothetical protein AAF401_02920 [Pseudomonadota bacterium]
MFGLTKYRDRARVWIKREIARYAQTNMLSYTAARQSLDIYEMRLETLDTRLCKRLRELEERVEQLEAANRIGREKVAPLKRKAG